MTQKRFEMPADGYVHLMPYGEFPHKRAGVIQVLDEVAADSIVKSFDTLKNSKGFSGMLVDKDHYSDLDEYTQKKLKGMGVALPSDAAGWIQDVQKRPNGIWAKIDFSNSGKESIDGGDYRFLSPVFPLATLENLGGGRVRPRSIGKAGLTNEPNLVGISALTNRVGGAGLIGPVCVLEGLANNQQEINTMDYKAILCGMLGIDPASDDAAIQTALDGMKNAKDKAQAEKDMTDLEKEGCAIANRAEVMPALIANRELTLKAIRAIKPAASVVKVEGLPNRSDGQTPGAVSTPDSVAPIADKARIAADFVNEVMREKGLANRQDAFAVATQLKPDLFK